MSKRIIQLTENDLRTIVENAVAKILQENRQLAINIDISNIPIEDLKKGYIDFRLIPKPSLYGHPLYEPSYIKEAVGDVVEPDEVMENIIRKYQLPQSLSMKAEFHHKIYVYIITAMIGINDKMVEEDMNKLGYFLSVKGEPQEIEGMKYQALQFEPTSQLQQDITDKIKNKYYILYHWTPNYNVENILRYGLAPSQKNSYFNYPPRTYLMEGTKDVDSIQALGQSLCFKNKSPNNDGQYALLKIDVRSLEDDIRFFYDPNSQIGIYTEQTIPNNKITIGTVVKFITNFD